MTSRRNGKTMTMAITEYRRSVHFHRTKVTFTR